MIELYIGSPGIGKTSRLIQRAEQLHKQRNKPIYWYGVRPDGILFESWQRLRVVMINCYPGQLPCYDVPKGIILVIDEAQDVFPPKKEFEHTENDFLFADIANFAKKRIDLLMAAQRLSLLNPLFGAMNIKTIHMKEPYKREIKSSAKKTEAIKANARGNTGLPNG
jgi:hypothetical protein